MRLAELTTLRVGGKCRDFIDCRTKEQLENSVKALIEDKKEFIVIGAGSNILVTDSGINVAVVRFFSSEPQIEINENILIVSGATLLDDMAEAAAQNSLSGINQLTGIPGTVAGALVGNAGAYGKSVSECLVSVEILDSQGNKKELPSAYFNFSYRDSGFKYEKYVISAAKFRLKKSDNEDLLKERSDIIIERSQKHPDWKDIPTAGSFFRNVEADSSVGRRQAAGYYLEQAGCKEMKVGGARVFGKHANIIITDGKAASSDVYELAKKMRAAVKDKFGINLVREVRYLGEFEGTPKGKASLFW